MIPFSFEYSRQAKRTENAFGKFIVDTKTTKAWNCFIINRDWHNIGHNITSETRKKTNIKQKSIVSTLWAHNILYNAIVQTKRTKGKRWVYFCTLSLWCGSINLLAGPHPFNSMGLCVNTQNDNNTKTALQSNKWNIWFKIIYFAIKRLKSFSWA